MMTMGTAQSLCTTGSSSPLSQCSATAAIKEPRAKVEINSVENLGESVGGGTPSAQLEGMGERC